jgi:hypothetical protein
MTAGTLLQTLTSNFGKTAEPTTKLAWKRRMEEAKRTLAQTPSLNLP